MALTTKLPSVRIVAEKAPQRASLHERDKADARSVDRTESLYRMDVSYHKILEKRVFILENKKNMRLALSEDDIARRMFKYMITYPY